MDLFTNHIDFDDSYLRRLENNEHVDDSSLLPLYNKPWLSKDATYDELYHKQLFNCMMGQHERYVVKAPFILKSKSNSNSKSKTKVDAIKNSAIKNILGTYPFNMFKFKSRQECVSRERSKSYYINKADLLNIINSDPKLVKRFPKGYKKLSKEELCDVIFDNGTRVV